MMSARVSCSVAQCSFVHAASSSQRGTVSGNGRSNTSPKYLAPEYDRCLMSPRRLVPDAVSGRRMSYSERPSSFQRIESRFQCRSSCRYSFANSSITGHEPATGRRWAQHCSIGPPRIAGMTKLRCALLDDFQDVATTVADWGPVLDRVEVTGFSRHFADEDELVAAVSGFDIIVTLRERVPFPASLFARLPRLKLLVASGMRNSVIDYAA